jgi:myo-inositol-1(or 4)-monophosphatase
MSEINLNEIHQFLMTIIPKCGNIIRDAFYKEKTIESKENYADFVTETDKGVEKVFYDSIRAKYPDHKYR